MKTNWNLSGQVEVKIKLMWLHKSAHPLTNTLLKHLLILLQLSVVWGMSLSAWHMAFGNICLLFFTKMFQICQIVRASLVHSPHQITPQIFDWIQVGALAGPFQTFNLLLVKPFVC